MTITETCLIQALFHRPDFMPAVLLHIDESYLTSEPAKFAFKVVMDCYDSESFDVNFVLHQCIHSGVDGMATFLTDVVSTLESAGILAETFAVDLVIEFDQALDSLDYERSVLSETE